MDEYENKIKNLIKNKKTWLITGVAGFIGSNLLETLLKLNQKVIGIDNFSTGFHKNLEEVKTKITSEQWKNFKLINGDIRNIEDCKKSFKYSNDKEEITIKGKNNIDYILHHAALGSVPRSIKEPLEVNENNVKGFLNILEASRESRVKKIIYASSSSIYGDSKILPKEESIIGKPLSPYAATKYINEIYAEVYAKNYKVKSIGLRYFNVFGERQNPKGEYAAVIPALIQALIEEKIFWINGDGENSRDFTYVENIIKANILAAMNEDENKIHEVYNIAMGNSITLNKLKEEIIKILEDKKIKYQNKIKYRNEREGDIKKSQADIRRAINDLRYIPKIEFEEGIERTIDWYVKNL